MDRRLFLKILGGTAAGVAVAPLIGGTTGPLFVPAQHLDFVPKPMIIVPTAAEEFDFDRAFDESRILDPRRTVPMMLVHDNYIPQHGGRLKAGSIVWEDEATAARWGARNVAVRCDGLEPKIIPGRDWGSTQPLPSHRSGDLWGLPVVEDATVPQDTFMVKAGDWSSAARVRDYREYEAEWVVPEPDPPRVNVSRRRLFQGWTRPLPRLWS